MSLLMASLQGLWAGVVKPGQEAPQGLEAPGTQGLSHRGSRVRPLQSARACLTPVHVHVRAHARSGPQRSVVPSPCEWLLPARGVIILVPS